MRDNRQHGEVAVERLVEFAFALKLATARQHERKQATLVPWPGPLVERTGVAKAARRPPARGEPQRQRPLVFCEPFRLGTRQPAPLSVHAKFGMDIQLARLAVHLSRLLR